MGDPNTSPLDGGRVTGGAWALSSVQSGSTHGCSHSCSQVGLQAIHLLNLHRTCTTMGKEAERTAGTRHTDSSG